MVERLSCHENHYGNPACAVTRGVLSPGRPSWKADGRRVQQPDRCASGRGDASSGWYQALLATTRVRVLAQNVDTIWLNVRYADAEGRPQPRPLDNEDLLLELDDYKRSAQRAGQNVPTRWEYDGWVLWMWPRAISHAAYVLQCPYFELCVDVGKLTGVIARVKVASVALWESPVQTVIVGIEQFLTEFLGTSHLHLQVSELHVAADFVGLPCERLPWREVVVTRARRARLLLGQSQHKRETAQAQLDLLEECYQGRQLQTVTFGSHASQISAQFYDKTAELERSGKQWLQTIWQAHGWDGQQRVWRLEFRLRRRALAEFGIDDPYCLEEQLPRLWAALVGSAQTEGWLRLVLPRRGDSNRTRWPVAPVWRLLQCWSLSTARQAGCCRAVVPLERLRKQKERRWKASAALLGYLMSLAASLVEEGVVDEQEVQLEELLRWLEAEIRVQLRLKQTTLRTELRRRLFKNQVVLQEVSSQGERKRTSGRWWQTHPSIWRRWLQRCIQQEGRRQED